MRPKACIILPIYNEAENIRELIPEIFNQQCFIKTHELHILVINDHSTDGTENILNQYKLDYQNLHVITGQKRGLGDAYKRGISHALSELSPDLVLQMDADWQHDPHLIPLLITLSTFGFSLIIGSRFVQGASSLDFAWHKRLLSLSGNCLIRFLGGFLRVRDCTSGFRCIHASLLPNCNLKFLGSSGYSFQSSFLFELLRNGAKVIEIPIVFASRKHGISKLGFHDQIDFLANVIKIRFRSTTEFLSFFIIGLFGIIANMGMYIILTRLAKLNMAIAAPIAIEISILSYFILNYIWSAKSEIVLSSWIKRLLKFHIIPCFGGIINYIILLLFVHFLGIWDVFAHLAGIATGTFFCYSLNSHRMWKELQ